MLSVERRMSSALSGKNKNSPDTQYSVRSGQYSVLHRIAPGSSSDRENSTVHGQDPKPHTSPLQFEFPPTIRICQTRERAAGERGGGYLAQRFGSNIAARLETCSCACAPVP